MRLLKQTFLAACFAVGFAVAPSAAYAGTSEGDRGTYTVSGVNYWNQAVISVGSGYASGQTKSGPDSHCVTPGSIAIRGKVFETAATGGAAALRAESIVWYTQATLCPGQYNGYSAGYSFSGFRYFYSQGDSWAWNTSSGSYNQYWTFATRTQNP